MKYKLIRDKQVTNFDESKIEVCDNRNEIVNFSIKEILNLVLELQESDCRDINIFADIYEVLNMLEEISYIDLSDVEDLMLWKIDNEGEYSRFLLKVSE